MSEPNRRLLDDAYPPIRDYGLIGDCHGSALVGRDGSIDWCCLGRFDADPIFCRILDETRGGFISVAPSESSSVSRSYLAGTNLLETVFTTSVGDLVVTDFMPVGRKRGSGTHNYVDLQAPHWLVRQVETRRGPVAVEVRYRPTIDFARQQPILRPEKNQIGADRGPSLVHNLGHFVLEDETARASINLSPGRRLMLIISAGAIDPVAALDRVNRYREATIAFWQEWIAYCRYAGPYGDTVRRSLLVIKLLTYAPSGAIVAAPTTSLPEAIGGPRNWDYRYCWLRDAAFALYALGIAGYGGEARRFSDYLPRVCAATAPDLRIMYGIEGETDLRERSLDYLSGYADSRPVRVGNGAHEQRQLDVYGEVLDWALLYETLGGKLTGGQRAMLAALADYVAEHWTEPDHGLWEMRKEPAQYVYGKIMSWVALDRAIRLCGTNDRWERERVRILSDVRAKGGLAECGHLVGVYNTREMDASLLRAPMVGFPINDELIQATVAAVERELRSGDLLYRYRADDGVEGREGAFLICSFWLVDAYLAIGSHREAKELLERLLGHANDLGLYSEEIDAKSGSFLGNFPQVYTHLALISSAAHLQLCERGGRKALQGSDANRAKLMVHATLGTAAIWAAFKATWKVGRIRPSQKSVLQ